MNAELHGAFCWDCDECGHENFVRGIEAELEEAVAREVCEDLIDVHFDCIPETNDGYFAESRSIITRVVIAPQHVKCVSCGKSYPTELVTNSDV